MLSSVGFLCPPKPSATVDDHGPTHVAPTVQLRDGTATTDLRVLEGGGGGESKIKLTA